MAGTHAPMTYTVFLAAIALLVAVCDGRLVATANDASPDEAVAQTEAWISAHPKDAAGYRVLAHVHGLAWTYGEKIPIVGTSVRDALPRFAEDSTVLVSRTGPRESLWMSKTVPAGTQPDRPVTADEAKHLSASIAAYRKAIELDPTDALSELGLAWMLVQEGRYARQLPADYFGKSKLTDAEKAACTQAVKQFADENFSVRDAASKALLAKMPGCIAMLRETKSDDQEVIARIDAVLQGYFELQSLDHYRKAFARNSQADLKGEPTYQADSQVSAKAGAQILSVLAKYPEAARKGETKAVQEVLDPLASKLGKLMMMPQ